MTDSENHDILTQRMDRLEASVSENTKLTQGIKEDTSEFLEVFRAVRGGFKVLGWLGNIAKWAAGLGAAVAGLYFALKSGGPHP
jgi:hypothetical protein